MRRVCLDRPAFGELCWIVQADLAITTSSENLFPMGYIDLIQLNKTWFGGLGLLTYWPRPAL